MSLIGLVVLTAFEEPRCCPSLTGCIANSPQGGGGGGSGGGGSGGGNPTPTPTPAPAWPPGEFGSDLPHNPNLIVSVSTAPSVSDWDSELVTHYNNARGTWNNQLGRLTFQNLPFGADMPQ